MGSVRRPARALLRVLLLCGAALQLTNGQIFEGLLLKDDIDKPGNCPQPKPQDECPPPGSLTNDCLVDRDCFSDLKCCTVGCSLKCTAPNITEIKEVCTVPIDLGFLIDVSKSIGDEGFKTIKEFVKSIINAYVIGPEDTHVGAIIYSDEARLLFSFNTFQGNDLTKETLFKEIDGIPGPPDGKTRIDLALRMAERDLFSTSGGVRPDKPKLLLVMTDGQQTTDDNIFPKVEALHVASKALKEGGTHVYSMGIGKNYDIGELLEIATDDASVFRAAGFDELLSVVSTLTENTCKACTKPVDVHFAIDSSNNISPEEFEKVKSFVAGLGEKFVISMRGAHLSASVYSDEAKPAFSFYDGVVKKEFLEAVKKIPYLGNVGTRMDTALRLAANEAFQLRGGTRQAAPKVLFLFTTGNCDSCKESLSAAVQPLKDAGVQVIAVTVGNQANPAELRDVVSHPKDQYINSVESYEKLINAVFIQKLSALACSSKPGKCFQTTRPSFCAPAITQKCRADQECPNDQKCCLEGCDRGCVPPKLACITPLDISFVFDSSKNIGSEGFQLLTNFASNLIDSFQFSAVDSHASAVTFGDKANVAFDFAQFYSAKKIKDELKSIEYLPSPTSSLSTVLDMAIDNIFSVKGRSRRGVPRVMVLLTDGADIPAEEEAAIQRKADLLKKSAFGTDIIVVGIGEKARNSSLLSSISSPSVSAAGKFFNMETFQDLAQYKEQLKVSKEICAAKVPQFKCKAVAPSPSCRTIDDECTTDFDCPGTYQCCPDTCRRRCIPTDDFCSKKIDLVLVLDDSAKNTDSESFFKVKEFAKQFIDAFDVKEVGTHVAAMTFSDTAKVSFNFTSLSAYDVSLTKEAIDKIPYTGGTSSRLDQALIKIHKEVLNDKAGARPNAEPVVVVITDGNTAKGSKALDTASWPLRGRDVKIVAISVGDKINEKNLENVVSLPVKENVFLAANYDDIMKNVRELTKTSCRPAQIRPPQPTVFKLGPPGPPGDKGNPGPLGDDGEIGNPGPDGNSGSKGDRGIKGEKGERGLAGPPGGSGGSTKGPDPMADMVGALLGDDGGDGVGVYTYLPGEEGPVGQDGPPGPSGPRGDAGEAGTVGREGRIGNPGDFGPIGPTGEPGAPGNKGAAGEPGPDGEVGPVGVAGATGAPGATGAAGYKGVKGADGLDGDAGDNGVEGGKGYKGSKGPQGDAGAQGTKGGPGASGPAGAVGLQGPRGLQGLAGEQGQFGDDGLPGPAGYAGSKGQKGNRGTSGAPGPKGNSGEIGPEGFQGTPGNRGSPGEDGAEGIVGPKGAKGKFGPVGQPGVTGQSGPQGPAGIAGAGGLAGVKGEDGPRGPRGQAGMKGDLGDKGPQGALGSQGPRGDRGTKGSPGAPGSPGSSGAPGRPGLPGATGSQGIQGSKGESGVQGGEGKLGAKGSRGRAGEAGEKGPRGEAGAIGRPGADGRDGKPGAQGLAGSDGGIGALGPMGPQGFPGTVGRTGAPGDGGPTGKRGAQGLSGKKGQSGRQGLPGQQGSAGNPGKQGASGEKGPDGVPGSIGLQGPSGAAGQQGLDGKAGQAGQRGQRGKPGKTGVTGESGPTGDHGPAGTPGDPGMPGRDGEPGPAGPSGENGLPGRDGPAGAQGPQGATGRPGPSGSEGGRGPQGVQGPKGSKGKDGLTGSKGPAGGDGRTGPPGARGPAGLEGKQGTPGESGKPGKMGPPGPEGHPGRPGPQGSRGQVGPAGALGPKGKPGNTGEEGEPGPDGFIGRPGLLGPEGLRGKRGSAGEIGEIGEIGLMGPPGPQGSQGPSGLPGPRGVAGNPGKQGSVGDVGDPGASGKRGPDGLRGPAGNDGKPGEPGKAGSNGLPGPAGAPGRVGMPGQAGDTGKPGRGGLNGAQGPKGPSGRDGAAGKDGKRGSRGKPGAAGAAGDPGTAGDDGNDGPDGTAGAVGAGGPKGERGDRGATGKSGEAGTPGAPGENGANGNDGPEGVRGRTGDAGVKGKDGSAGGRGDGGPKGPSGPVGVVGEKGFKGTMGRSGIPGLSGLAGMKGEQGLTGRNGPEGIIGNRGESGADGEIGPQGEEGIDGLSGQNGSPGYQGDSGDSGNPGLPGRPGPAGPAGPPGDFGAGSLDDGSFDIFANGNEKGPAWRRYRRDTESQAEQAINKRHDLFKKFYGQLRKIDLLRSGRGTLDSPARTCRELFTWFPSLKSDDYFIDPNGGSPYDQFKVFCNRTSMQTCLFPKQPNFETSKWHIGSDAYKWAMEIYENNPYGVEYAADLDQIKMLQLLSRAVSQNITYSCRNSYAWHNSKGDIHSDTIKIRMDDESEFHAAKALRHLRVTVVKDSCKVKDDTFREAVFDLKTEATKYLPIMDMAAHDIGGPKEEFGWKIGPVCFT